MIKPIYNANHPDYRECDALQELLVAAKATIAEECDRIDNNLCETYEQFTINIHGRSIAFYAGPAQIEGIYAFIKHMAGENLHCVDIAAGTVTGTL